MVITKIIWPNHPKILEINTWPWTKSLSRLYEHYIDLKNIPEEFFEGDICSFDAIWLMGVWERSPSSRKIAQVHPDLQAEYHKALKDFVPDDVIGSPYAIHFYRVDKNLGGNEGLRIFREQLAKNNINLLLDYVPNHVAIDHPWTLEKSDIFIQGTAYDIKNQPHEFFSVEDRIYAHGHDPYFPAWTDTVQINAYSQEARNQAINTLFNIAELCDGVRCDMAMLLTNEIFLRTWGERADVPPEKEFWQEVISVVREKYPNFIFIAEVYWDMEWELLQQGFDYCYDKRLYDRMLHENAETIRHHLQADRVYQRKLVRFIENHDEERAITAFGEGRSQAAAILALTLPGARLIHEGQMQGKKTRLPVQLGRSPIEKDNEDLLNFYKVLLRAASDEDLELSKWSLCHIDPVGLDDYSFTNIIVYQWWNNEALKLIVVNYSSTPAQGHIRVNELSYGSNKWSFKDLLTGATYTYKGENLDKFGLYVELTAWNGHIFDVKKRE